MTTPKTLTPKTLKVDPELLKDIGEAKGQLEVAERELHRLMEELVVADRSNKQMVSKAISTAMDAVRSARLKLDKIP